MADPVQIAKRRELALKKLVENTQAIAETLGIAPPVVREHARDRTYLEADRLDTLADWLEAARAALEARLAKKKSKADERAAAPVDTSEPLTHEEPDGTTTHV
jgi:preprotein translocase subunit SecD